MSKGNRLGTWEQGVPEGAHWQYHFAHTQELAQALAALRSWLREPGADAEAQLHARLTALRQRVSAAESYTEECAGSDGRGRRLRQCAAAGGAIQLALEAATWTAEQATAGTVDDGERQAITAAGPAREAWGAVRAFLVAHPEASERVARDHIRRVLMAPR